MAPKLDRHGKPIKDKPRSRSPSPDSDPETPRYVQEPVQQQAYYVNPLFVREQSSSRTSTRPEERPSPAKQFAIAVALNDLQASRAYLRDNPDILRETNLKQVYLDPAIQQLAAGTETSRRLAFSFMEKYTIIRATNAYKSAKRDNFLDLCIAREAGATETFRSTFEKVKAQCDEEVLVGGTRSLEITRRPSRDVETPGNRPSAAREASVSQGGGYRNSSEQLEGVKEDRHGPKQIPQSQARSPPRSRPCPPEAASPLRDSLDNYRTQDMSTPRANVQSPIPIQDDRFVKLIPRDWSYFKPGRVFAMIIYSNDNTAPGEPGDDFSMDRVQTARGGEVLEKVRRMIVVRAREGFCLTVPINTYGGRGLKKLGFRENNINSHARVHMNNKSPIWLAGEPESGKRDIAVTPADRNQELHSASRICFERTHSIEYNEKIMKIGTVIPDHVTRLVAYWENEQNRPSGQGRKRAATTENPKKDHHKKDDDNQGDQNQRKSRHTDPTDRKSSKGYR